MGGAVDGWRCMLRATWQPRPAVCSQPAEPLGNPNHCIMYHLFTGLAVVSDAQALSSKRSGHNARPARCAAPGEANPRSKDPCTLGAVTEFCAAAILAVDLAVEKQAPRCGRIPPANAFERSVSAARCSHHCRADPARQVQQQTKR